LFIIVIFKIKYHLMAAYKRVLLKLSGEALMADRSHGIDPVRLGAYIDEIIEIRGRQHLPGYVRGGGGF
jgi:uridylate kinase